MFSAGSAKYLKHDAGMKMKIHRGRTEVVSTIYTKKLFFSFKEPEKFYNQAVCVATNDRNRKPRQSWQSKKSSSDHYVRLLRQSFY